MRCIAGICDSPPACGGATQSCCTGDRCDPGLRCENGACAACGTPTRRCCTEGPACAAGSLCRDGTCVACGGSGESCCDGLCRDHRSCVANRCSTCGAADMACCPARTCESGLRCVPAVSGELCRRCGDDQDPCCLGATPCNGALMCLPSGRCGAPLPVCGTPFQPCCAGGVCQGDTLCVDDEVAAALDAGVGDVTDGGDATSDVTDADTSDADADSADAGDVDADDATDAADDLGPRDIAEVSDDIVDDAHDEAVLAAFGVCLPCGAEDGPCCAGLSCRGAELVCDPQADVVPRCARCGVAGAPCCPGSGPCRDGSRCVSRPRDIARCVSTRDASIDAR